MNGKLNLTTITRKLSGQVEHLNTYWADDEFTVSEIRGMMNSLTEDMVKAANSNPDHVARELFDNDTEGYYLTHKIQGIKEIRERSSCGLREAKLAFEAQLPIHARNFAIRALRQLEAANNATSYGHAAYINAPDFPNSIKD